MDPTSQKVSRCQQLWGTGIDISMQRKISITNQNPLSELPEAPFRVEWFQDKSQCRGKQSGSHKVVSLWKKKMEKYY